MKITPKTSIEEIVEKYPQLVKILLIMELSA